MSAGDRKGTFKVEFLKDVERKAQEKWEKMKVYEMDAPESGAGTPGNQSTVILTLWETAVADIYNVELVLGIV